MLLWFGDDFNHKIRVGFGISHGLFDVLFRKHNFGLALFIGIFLIFCWFGDLGLGGCLSFGEIGFGSFVMRLLDFCPDTFEVVDIFLVVEIITSFFRFHNVL